MSHSSPVSRTGSCRQREEVSIGDQSSGSGKKYENELIGNLLVCGLHLAADDAVTKAVVVLVVFIAA